MAGPLLAAAAPLYFCFPAAKPGCAGPPALPAAPSPPLPSVSPLARLTPLRPETCEPAREPGALPMSLLCVEVAVAAL